MLRDFTTKSLRILFMARAHVDLPVRVGRTVMQHELLPSGPARPQQP